MKNIVDQVEECSAVYLYSRPLHESKNILWSLQSRQTSILTADLEKVASGKLAALECSQNSIIRDKNMCIKCWCGIAL